MPIRRTDPQRTAPASSEVDHDDRASDLPILDAPTLTNFLSVQRSDYSTDFVPHFQEMTRYRLTAALRAAEDGNWTAVAASIRDMGSEAESLGLRRWEAQCRKIEARCAEGQTDAAGSLVSGLQQYCLEGVDAVRSFVHTNNTRGRPDQ